MLIFERIELGRLVLGEFSKNSLTKNVIRDSESKLLQISEGYVDQGSLHKIIQF
jgi:hypothetical protein